MQFELRGEGSQFRPKDGEDSCRFQEKTTYSPELDCHLCDSQRFFPWPAPLSESDVGFMS